MTQKSIHILRNWPTCPCGKRLSARQKKYCSHKCKNKYTIRKTYGDKALEDNWITFGEDE